MSLIDWVMTKLEPKSYKMTDFEELNYLSSLVPESNDATAIQKMVNELRPRLRKWMELHPKDDVNKVKKDFRAAYKG